MQWLMLITEVPSKPDYLRVKLRRRVQRLGAVGLKGAVFILPDSADSMAGFQGLRREIIADGGNATLCRATLLDGMRDVDATSLFNSERDAEYAVIAADCAELAREWVAGDRSEHGRLLIQRARIFNRIEEVLRRDFFGAPSRESAMIAMEELAGLSL